MHRSRAGHLTERRPLCEGAEVCCGEEMPENRGGHFHTVGSGSGACCHPLYTRSRGLNTLYGPGSDAGFLFNRQDDRQRMAVCATAPSDERYNRRRVSDCNRSHGVTTCDLFQMRARELGARHTTGSRTVASDIVSGLTLNLRGDEPSPRRKFNIQDYHMGRC